MKLNDTETLGLALSTGNCVGLASSMGSTVHTVFKRIDDPLDCNGIHQLSNAQQCLFEPLPQA